MVLVALEADARATGAGTWLGATPGGVTFAGAGRAGAGAGRSAREPGRRRAPQLREPAPPWRRGWPGWSALSRVPERHAAAAAFAASAAARALMISAAGMPKMVLVALEWRAACADGAGAGTFAGAAAAACGRFGATAGSFKRLDDDAVVARRPLHHLGEPFGRVDAAHGHAVDLAALVVHARVLVATPHLDLAGDDVVLAVAHQVRERAALQRPRVRTRVRQIAVGGVGQPLLHAEPRRLARAQLVERVVRRLAAVKRVRHAAREQVHLADRGVARRAEHLDPRRQGGSAQDRDQVIQIAAAPVLGPALRDRAASRRRISGAGDRGRSDRPVRWHPRGRRS